jgi:hypothetical protein
MLTYADVCRFALARRWHAQLCFKKGDLKNAIVYFKEALAISQFYPDRS